MAPLGVTQNRYRWTLLDIGGHRRHIRVSHPNGSESSRLLSNVGHTHAVPV